MSKLRFAVATVLILSACSGGTLNLTTSTETTLIASPGYINSSSPSPSTTTEPSPRMTLINLPTPTQILYTVVLNDNLSSIAKKFNITLDELLAANPKIGSQTLTVGTVLTIPSGQGGSSAPTTTPVPVEIQQVQCFPNEDGSTYCLAVLKNDHPEPLQNLTVLIDLVAPDGTSVGSQIAYPLLDLLPAGKAIPLAVLFPAPIPPDSQPQARLLSASLVASASPYYLSISVLKSLVEVDWGGLTARISGQFGLTNSELPANRVWILAVAYDQNNSVIGFTRWESDVPLASTDQLPFEFMVASLGGQIDHVQLIAEAIK